MWDLIDGLAVIAAIIGVLALILTITCAFIQGSRVEEYLRRSLEEPPKLTPEELEDLEMEWPSYEEKADF